MHRASHPCHKGTLICGEGLSISFLKKKQLRMKQCWAVGFSILELSKHTMARLYYHEILPRLGHENVDIIMSDTDSFLLKVTGYAEHDIMEKLADIMDFSNLDETHPLHDKSRNKIPGYLKNEVPKTVIMEVVALKSKTYAIRFLSGETKNTAKGVVRSVKDRIPFEKFKNCLDRMMKYEVQQYNLRSTNHLNQMMESKKVAFSSFDDKRYLLCPIHSTPYGSWMIDSEKMGGCYFCRKDSV